MKYYLLAAALTIFSAANAQVKVTQGGNSPQFMLTNQPDVSSFSTDAADMIILHRVENFDHINTMIVADKTGNITLSKDVRVNMGTFNNNFEVRALLVVNNKPYAFVENHSKDALKNSLEARAVDNAGNVAPSGVKIGDIEFAKMSNPGDWYAALTPDKKHVAVIARFGHEKDKPDQFKYFLLDENLKETGNGQFSFAGNTKQIGISKFFASNKGDIYILADEFDKSYKMPVLYQYAPGGQANIIPVMMADPTLRNLSYTAKLDPSGNLLVAGYAQKKKAFVADDPDAVATYIFSSAKPNEVKVSNFDQPVKGLAARNILFNGNTYFLVGEQYRPEKVRPQGNALSMDVLKDVFDYTHGDIEVTGFSADLTKKFDMPISRKMPAQRDMDSDLGVASGIVNNKLVVVFNDLHGKYIDDKYYKTLKLPVAVAVTNDGLMEAPVTFAKEFDVKLSTYKLHPALFNADGSKLVVLSVNDRSVKTATFK